VAAIRRSRERLAGEEDAVERHLNYLALEEALYGCRDVYRSALAEFEEACESHHGEMERIRPALVERYEGIPVLATYRQMAIAKEKAKDYRSALDWCRRGLEVYGDSALRPDAVDDLRARTEKLSAKLDG